MLPQAGNSFDLLDPGEAKRPLPAWNAGTGSIPIGITLLPCKSDA